MSGGIPSFRSGQVEPFVTEHGDRHPDAIVDGHEVYIDAAECEVGGHDVASSRCEARCFAGGPGCELPTLHAGHHRAGDVSWRWTITPDEDGR